MSRTYACYLHKPGVMTPELRFVICERAHDLPRAILGQLRTWGEFDKVEVFDSRDRPLFCFTPALQPAH